MFVQTIFTKKTLNQDINEHLSEQNIQYMLNGDLYSTATEGSQMFLQNQLSNELNLDLQTSKLCGFVKLDRHQFVLFFEPGEIGLYDSDKKQYTRWAFSNCLNFSVNKWVTGVYKYIKEKRWIYFVDGVNPIRYLNIDDESPKEYDNCRDCNDEPKTNFDCDRIRLFKNFNIPKIKISQIEGNLPNGNYQVAIRFTDNQIGISEYYIYADNLKLHSNYNRRFGLKLDFDCFNTDYEEYEIVLIANRADRGTVGQSVGFFDVSVRNVVITELDSAKYHPVDSANLLEVKPYYQSAQHIAENNENLILGSVKTRPPINYHPQAFKIKSNWVSLKVPKEHAHKFKSYMRDEVYAHNIRWIYKDGERTNWFHIKPQVEKPSSELTINQNDIWDDCETTTKKYWEIYNTATVDSTNTISKEFKNAKIQIFPNCIKYENNTTLPQTPKLTYKNCQGIIVTQKLNPGDVIYASDIISCVNQNRDVLPLFFGNRNPITGFYDDPLELIATPIFSNVSLTYINSANITKQVTYNTISAGNDVIKLNCVLEGSITSTNTKIKVLEYTDCNQVVINSNEPCTLHRVVVNDFWQTITGKTTIGFIYPKQGICIKYTNTNNALTYKIIFDDDWTINIKYNTPFDFYEVDPSTKNCTNTPIVDNINYTSYVNFDVVRGNYTDCTNNTQTFFQISPDKDSNSVPTPKIFCIKDKLLFENSTIVNYTVTTLGPCSPANNDSSSITSCAEYTIYKKGNFAYWESTLTYPDLPEFGEYRCKPIQYHKFPDNKISPHHELDSISDCIAYEYASILTIVFENIEFPKDENGNFIPDIVGYEIGVNDRTGNKSVLHKGLLYNMRQEPLETINCQQGFYPNYPFNDLGADKYIGSKWTSNPSDISLLFGEEEHKGLKDYSKSYFSYISPNINFVRNDQGSELVLYEESVGDINGKFSTTIEMPKFSLASSFFYFITATILTAAVVGGIFGVLGSNVIQTTLDSLRITIEILKASIVPLQHAKNYFAKANYLKSDFSNIKLGNKRRKIEVSQFLSPTKVIVDNTKINNYQREASLFIKIKGEFTDPKIKDNSRIVQTDIFCSREFNSCYTEINEEPLQASSYYAGIKNYNPGQYGDLYTASIIQATNILTDSFSGLVFGGDIYVTKHKQVRKMPFFSDLPVGLNANEYFTLSDKANVGIPRFYVDHLPENDIAKTLSSVAGIRQIANIISAVTNQRDSNQPFHLDATTNYRKELCEAISNNCMNKEFIMPAKAVGGSLNISIANWTNNSVRYLLNVQGNFYTHAIGVIEYWCESEFIGNYREFNNVPQSNIDRAENELTSYNTILYPELFLYDLSMLAKNTYKPTPFHKINSYSYNVLNDFKVPFSLKDNIESGLDNWRIFKPANYHQFTPADGKLTTIHSINDYNLLFAFENAIYITQSDDGIITNQGSTAFLGVGSIFQRRMKRLSDEQTGFCGSVDKFSFCNSRFGTLWIDRLRKRIFLYDSNTKDITTGLESWVNTYLPSNVPENYFESVRCIFDNFTKNFYITYNNDDNSSAWTLSYKPELKSFISFHSFTPKAYLQLPNSFLSIDFNENGVWKHNKLYDYQTYYDKFYNFDVGYSITHKAFKKIALNSIELGAQFFKEISYNKRQYFTDVFFNKFCVYNSHVSTGIKNIVFKSPQKSPQSLDQSLSEVTEIDSHIYRINGVKNYAVPTGNGTLLVENTGPMSYALFNYDYKTPVTNQGKIQGKLLNVHFINSEHNLKIMMHYGIYNVEEVDQ